MDGLVAGFTGTVISAIRMEIDSFIYIRFQTNEEDACTLYSMECSIVVQQIVDYVTFLPVLVFACTHQLVLSMIVNVDNDQNAFRHCLCISRQARLRSLLFPRQRATVGLHRCQTATKSILNYAERTKRL